MRCNGCGSEMDVVFETVEGNKRYQWYACRQHTCQQELLHITADCATERVTATRVTAASGPATG